MGAAQSCIRAGLTTYGVDLNPTALEKLKTDGAHATSQSAVDFADKLDAVLLLVVNAVQVNSVLFGENGLAAKLNKGAAVMVSSTISAQDAKAISQKLTDFGLIMLDAPVSGGAAKAALGEMTVMAAGSAQAFAKLQPVLDAVAGKVYNIGEEIGLGATVKIIHQLLAGVHIAAGAEAMALAAKAGIPLNLMYDVVTNAAGNSWMFENRMKHVVEGDYSPLSMVDIFVKDLGLVNDTAKSLHFPLHLASTAYSMFTEASNAGYGKEDDSAVIKIFSGIELPKKGA
ncbi:3-hydroxyisobutyrate dehydrogenase [Aggregatibacter actinomycetemcomitans RhAA1]|nr:3-hydroxyisobutyrate dehydrogenase [Aggregatibacter actinomycetemcomitans RhAA1]